VVSQQAGSSGLATMGGQDTATVHGGGEWEDASDYVWGSGTCYKQGVLYELEMQKGPYWSRNSERKWTADTFALKYLMSYINKAGQYTPY